MIWDIVEYAATLTEAIMAAYFLTRYNGYRYEKHGLTMAAFTLALAACTTFFNSFTSFEGLYGFTYVAILFVLSLLLLKGSIAEKLFASVISIVLIAVINIVVLTLFSSILDRNISELINDRNIFRCMILFITKFLYFMAVYFVLGMKHKIVNRLHRLEWTMVILIFGTSLIVTLFIFEFAYQFELSAMNYFFLNAAAISMVIINAVTFYLFTMLNKHQNEKLQLSKLQVQVAQQSKSLNDLKELSLEMQKIRHDVSKYLDITTDLIASGKTEQALQYLSEIRTEKIDHTFHLITTSSDIINALLNTKLSYCKKHGIDFIYQITADLSAFSEMDLSVLLGNLLDNAIEAAVQCEHPFVKITISENKAYLVMIITNSISGSILEENPDFITTKKEKHRHGLGLLTVKDVVTKYDGMFNISEEAGSLSVDVRLKFQ